MGQLIQQTFVRAFQNPELSRQQDSAILAAPEGKMAFTTDSYVVQPLFFPGGDIGSLAVHGTINDLAMAGAQPLALSAAFILEEGLLLSDLERVVQSMARAASEVGAAIVTGDTKVVERGKGDGIFITTTGLGTLAPGVDLGVHRVQEGDWILVNGPIAAHGVAILSVREGLEFDSEVVTDSAPLHGEVAGLFQAVGCQAVRLMRDPTRGGVASVLCELAKLGGFGVLLEEEAVPVEPQVKAVCELFGLDPLYVANEGRFLVFVDSTAGPAALEALGPLAVKIGEVSTRFPNQVVLRNALGGLRVVDLLSGEQLPRIC